MRFKRSNRICAAAVVETLEHRTLLADAAFVKDVFAGADSGFSVGSKIATAAGKTYFIGNDAASGFEVWVTNGTSTGTLLLKDIAPGASSSSPDSLTAAGSTVYFRATDGAGKTDVWSSDGTPANTRKVTNTAHSPVTINAVNGFLLFSDSTDGGLYRSTPSGLVATLNSTLRAITWLGISNNRMFFYARDGLGSTGLWFTDGTNLTFVTDPDPTSNNENLAPGAAIGAKLVYGQEVGDNGTELWTTDGTSVGTHRVASEINSVSFASAEPGDFVTVGSKVYFTATDDSSFQVYSTNGTTWSKHTSLSGTQIAGSVRELTDVNGTLFFSYAGIGVTRRLYKLTGGTTATPVGTVSGGPDGGTQPAFITAVGATVYFSGLDTAGKARLFQSDGTTIAKVTGDAGENPTALSNANGTLIFFADDDARGVEPRSIGAAPAEPVGVRIKAFPTAKGHTTSLEEGESITFQPITTGPSILAYYWDFGDGAGLRRSTRKPTHRYGDNFPDDTPSKIRVKVIGTDGSVANAYIDDFVVRNVRPKLKFFVPKGFVTVAPMPWRAQITDPGDNLDGMRLTIDWGDGSPREDIHVLPGQELSGHHIFTSPQINLQNIQARAIDHDRDYDSALRTVPVVDGVQRFLDDPVNTLLDLKGIYMGGSVGSKRIKIDKASNQPSTGAVNINFNYGGTIQTFGLAPNETIYAYFGGGNDRVEVAADIFNSTYINAGGGNDTIFGGGGNDFLVGGPGADKLYGNGGRNRIKA